MKIEIGNMEKKLQRIELQLRLIKGILSRTRIDKNGMVLMPIEDLKTIRKLNKSKKIKQ